MENYLYFIRPVTVSFRLPFPDESCRSSPPPLNHKRSLHTNLGRAGRFKTPTREKEDLFGVVKAGQEIYVV